MSVRASLLALADFIAGQAPTLPTRPAVEDTATYIPQPADLAALQADDPAEALAGVRRYVQEVQARWQQAVGHGLLGTLQSIGDESFRPTPPAASLHGATIGNFAYRLDLDANSHPTAAARNMMLQPASAVADLALSGSLPMVETLTALRNLDDLIIRILGARTAALGVPGASLAEALALYRAEGNLAAPRSAASLADLIPPSVTPAEATSNQVQGIKPNMTQLVCLFRVQDLPSRSLDDVKRLGLWLWLLQIAGHDALVSNAARYEDWARENWSAVLGSTPSSPFVDDRSHRLTALKDGIVANVTGRTTTGRYFSAPYRDDVQYAPGSVVALAPTDPVELVAFALEEGLALFQRLSHPPLGSLDLGHRPDALTETDELSYVLYNLVMGGAEAFLTSAVIHAHRPGSEASPSLRSAIADDPGFGATMDQAAQRIRGLSKDQTRDDYWSDVQAWLRAGGDHSVGKQRYRLVNDFVGSASGTGDWSSWNSPTLGSPRGNAARYRQLREFYAAALS